MKDIYLIRGYKTKEGEEKSEWCKIGVAFDPNNDGSVNISLYTMPGITLQMREREERKSKTRKAAF